MIEFKVGILGAGHIAGKIADTLNKLDAFCPYAIASRDIDRANEFGDKYNIEKRYGSYEELANDPEVELIYIATPHSHHAEQAKMCINAGKPVLVEKAFTCDAASAMEVMKLSEEKKVFCGEAMWIRFLPMYMRLADILNKGVIGRVNSLTCSLGYDLRNKERVTNPELGGGALLDLGVYTLNLSTMIFKAPPAAIASSCARLNTGVDAQEVLQLNYKNGGSCHAFVTMLYNAENNAIIYGDKGYIEIKNINCPEEIIVHVHQKVVGGFKIPEKQISGYEYEFIEARDAIITGKIETSLMPHADTVNILTLVDTLRKNWNLS
ncbi:MAG: Gfo/Idh/MocA family oxidoreductase [Lachnospiraceae bacterium]|nr:Gfo/Idh/MocA family oxidoreductase [Lachnospiraceae bacterium]